ncbi:MAG: PHB depolymerase family esterase [Thermoanaerobaculia bacterium]|nr:PHB depolymerase family esterase [Thermoanaerobaculia bacterium]
MRIGTVSRFTTFAVSATLLLLATTAVAHSRRAERASDTLRAGVLHHEGMAREYYLEMGVGTPETRRPLLLVLHGGRGSAERIASYAGFGEMARREGWVIAYPQAVDRNWHDGREVPRYRSHREKIDDIGFLSALIDRLIEDQRVDPDRVYVVGPSNGGMMAYRLALEVPFKLAGAAAVIANLPEPLAEAHAGRADESVPLLIINGTADPLMPHEGGEIRFGIWGGLGRVLSTFETARFFAERGGCDPTPRRSPAADADPDDGIGVERLRFGGAETGCKVELYVLEGGGHTWPGGRQYAPAALVGPATESLDATALVWSFFGVGSL